MSIVELRPIIDENLAASIQKRDEPPQLLDSLELDAGSIFSLWLQRDADMPNWWSRRRDYVLRDYLRYGDDLTRGAIFGERTRAKNMPYKLTNTEDPDDEEKLEDWYYIIQSADFGLGFNEFKAKCCLDYLTQDNGFFVELIPQGSDPRVVMPPTDQFRVGGELAEDISGQGIGGLAHLDARQCWRTNDPEYPVIYINSFTGKYVILHWSRVIARSDFTQPDEQARGIGFCALSRIFQSARLVNTMQKYYFEKITGGDTDLAIMQNIDRRQLENAVVDGRMQNIQRGKDVHRNLNIITALNHAVKPTLELFSFKGLPDGFEHATEIEIVVNIIATAMGLDVGEIWTIAKGALGDVKGAAEVTHRKASKKGRDDFLRTFEEIMNTRVLPEGIQFEFDQQDDAEDLHRAEIKDIRARTRQTQILSGELSAEEARIMAAEEGDINAEFLKTRTVVAQEENVQAVDTATSEENAGEETDVETAVTEALEEEKSYRVGLPVKKKRIPQRLTPI